MASARQWLESEGSWGGASSPSVTDGWPIDIVAGVEVEPVTGCDVVVWTCDHTLLHVDVQSIVLEHSTGGELFGKLV